MCLIMNAIIYLFIVICFIPQSTNAYRGDFMSGQRDGYHRTDPDATLNGFFPFWGVLLILLSFIFLLVAGVGLFGYLMGCRAPPDKLRQHIDPATFFA